MIGAIIGLLLLGQVPTTGRGVPDAALIESAKAADVVRTRELVASGARVNAVDWRGFTPLMWASASGQLAVTRHLLDSGARVDMRALDGTTALMIAAANGTTDIVLLLLSRGADVAAAKNGVTARQLALARGHAEIAAMLEHAEVLGARLLQAAADGQSMFVRQLLASGAPYNITNSQGVTPLMMAAGYGDLGTLQFLLSRGADGSLRDAQGQSVIDWAERSPSTGRFVAAFLRERGVQPAAVPIAAPPAPGVAASLKALDQLLLRVAPTPATANAHRRATSAVAELRKLSVSWPAESPRDYNVNLAEDVRTLTSAIERADPVRLQEVLNVVAEDLETKLEHCRKSGGRLGGSVLVRVRTIKGSEETRSWQILYIPKILEVSKTATPDVFPQLSSPSEESLVPGRYVMWVRLPNTSRVGERTVVKVGEGRKELLVDLPVPPDPAR